MVLPIRSIKNSKEIEELLTAMKLTKVAFTPLF
jgi:Xaa-Pro aminopeptidase